MRILQVVSDLNLSNGITNVLMRYFRKMSTTDIRFDFLCFDCDESDIKSNYFKEEIEKLGGRVFYINSPLNFFAFRKDWNKFCREHFQQFSILENNIPFLGFFFKNAKQMLGVKKIITHAHATKFGDNAFTNLRNQMFMIITGYKVGDILFAASEEAANKIFKWHLRKKPLYIINNAFDLSNFVFNIERRKNVRKRMNWDGKYIVGHVGRFTSQKNHKLIINAFRSLCKQDQTAYLVLIGEGELLPQIKKIVTEYGLNNRVCFLKRRSDVNELLQGMDTFIFPSVFEGLGVAVVEAQVAGVPCLVSDNVPKEANISKYKILSNRTSSMVWGKELYKLKNKARILNGIKLAQKKGFDINLEFQKLVKIYHQLN